MTYADIVRPSSKRLALLFDVAVILAGSLIIALTAQIAFPLPFTPVPVTGQTFGVLIIASLLGSKRGTLAVVTYLLEGMAGLPFFAEASAGTLILAGTSGGYLIGFIFAAFIVGTLAEKGWDRYFGSTILMMVLGTVAIFLFGVVWLAQLVGISNVLFLGVLPFITGAVFKIILAALLLPSGWKLLHQIGFDNR